MSKNIVKLLKIGKKYVIIYIPKDKKELRKFKNFVTKQKEEDCSPSNNGVRFMCKAAEVGKIIINKCIDSNLFIDAQKLQKLLVLMQVDCIRRSNKPLFKEDIKIWNCGVAIKEVDEEFRGVGGPFTTKQIEYINLLEQEEKSVNTILEQFGKMDAIELNLLPVNQRVISLAIKTDDTSTPYVSYQILMGAFLEE